MRMPRSAICDIVLTRGRATVSLRGELVIGASSGSEVQMPAGNIIFTNILD